MIYTNIIPIYHQNWDPEIARRLRADIWLRVFMPGDGPGSSRDQETWLLDVKIHGTQMDMMDIIHIMDIMDTNGYNSYNSWNINLNGISFINNG